MPSRLNPLRGLVHGSIEGLGPVPFVQPLCKHLHRPLSHRDLPSAFICALVHRKDRTCGCRWCIPKSVSVAESCGNCQLLLQSRTFLRRCRGKPGLEPRRSARVMSSRLWRRRMPVLSLLPNYHPSDPAKCLIVTGLGWRRNSLACFGLVGAAVGLTEW